MSDLRGLPAREAAAAAARQGLIVELKGSGRVVAQTPAPGTELEAVMTCVLTLSRTPVQGGAPAGEAP
jgi:beta-lactam-binding protein with PASTA domain